MVPNEDEVGRLLQMLEDWCGRAQCDSDDPRFATLVHVVPSGLLEELLEAVPDRRRVSASLARIGDPARSTDQFWKYVRAPGALDRSVGEGGIAPGRLAHARICICLTDLLQVLDSMSRADEAHTARIDGLARDDRHRREDEAEARVFDENGNIRPNRVAQRSMARGDEDPGAIDPTESDDADSADHEGAVSDLQEEGEERLGAEELDDVESTDEDDESFDGNGDIGADPVTELLDRVAGRLRELHAVHEQHRALPAEIIRRSDLLAQRGCPQQAAWFLGQADAELDVEDASADAGPIRDHAGTIALLSKGLEVTLRHVLLSRSPRQATLGASLKALCDAVTGRGAWPSGVPFVHHTQDGARLRTEVAVWPAVRLAWIAAGIKAVAETCRNGYIHSHAAARAVAEDFRMFLLAPRGFLEFLTGGAQPEPDQSVQEAIRRLLGLHPALAAESAAVWLAPIPRSTGTNEHEEVDEPHFADADMSDSERTWHLLRQPKYDPLPNVALAAILESGSDSRRSPTPPRDLGRLTHHLFTLRWRVPANRIFVEWWSVKESTQERILVTAFARPADPLPHADDEGPGPAHTSPKSRPSSSGRAVSAGNEEVDNESFRRGESNGPRSRSGDEQMPG